METEVRKEVALDIIGLDGGTQIREVKKSWVDEISSQMLDGVEMPPIVLFKDNENNYWLADGFHRFSAAKKNALKSIKAEIKSGSARDALLYALSCNSRSGLSLTSAQKRQNVIRMLKDKEWGKWVAKEIARHCGVSSMTVGRIKTELAQSGEIANETNRKTIKNGQEITMNTANIGRQAKKEQPQEEEAESFDADQMSELSATLSDLEEENRKLKDVIAVQSWDASEIEKEDAQQIIDDLRERIKVLEIEVDSLRESRDSFQNRCAELMKTVKTLQAKLKKLETV